MALPFREARNDLLLIFCVFLFFRFVLSLWVSRVFSFMRVAWEFRFMKLASFPCLGIPVVRGRGAIKGVLTPTTGSYCYRKRKNKQDVGFPHKIWHISHALNLPRDVVLQHSQIHKFQISAFRVGKEVNTDSCKRTRLHTHLHVNGYKASSSAAFAVTNVIFETTGRVRK